MNELVHIKQRDPSVDREMKDIVVLLNTLVKKVADPSSSFSSDSGKQAVQGLSIAQNLYSMLLKSKDGFLYMLPGFLQKTTQAPLRGAEGQVVVADKEGNAKWAEVSTVGAVVDVTGSAPIVSSGGATPDISIPKATASVDGYLDNADWTIFNNKLDLADIPQMRFTAQAISANVLTEIAYSTALPAGTTYAKIVYCVDASGEEVQVTLSTITNVHCYALCPVAATIVVMSFQVF